MNRPKLNLRIEIISAAIYVMAIILLLGLFWHQVINRNKYLDLSQDNSLRIIPIEAPRGRILDRNKEPLVANRLCFDVVAFSEDNPFSFKVIEKDIDRGRAFSLEEKSSQLTGVMVQASSLRQYLYNEVGSHILGYIGKIDPEEFAGWNIFGYRFYDRVGKDGIEKNYDAYLKGINGAEQIIVDNRGRKIKTLSRTLPTPGKDLELTIDLGLQIFVHNLLLDKKGSIIVMDPRDGQILAMESSPGFDPNIFVSPDRRTEALLQDARHPLFNRAVQGQYAAGSIFKIVVAAGGLEEKAIKPDTRFYCSGFYHLENSRFKCWLDTGHGNIEIHNALAYSCNVFFYNVGRSLNADRIARYARLFGLGKKTGIDLNNEEAGVVPDKKWKKKTKNENWYEGETLLYSIGQGFLLITPIQALQVISVIANGGYIVQPYLVKNIGAVDVSSKRVEKINIKKENLDTIKNALKDTVEGPLGTGQRAKVFDIAIAAKTGTAQAAGGEPHAWFIGFAPAEEPKISFVIMLERGVSGGGEAAVFAKNIVEYIRDYTDLLK